MPLASVDWAAAWAGSIVTGAGQVGAVGLPLNTGVRPVASIAVRLKSSVTLPTHGHGLADVAGGAVGRADSPPTKIPSEVAGFASWSAVGVST